MKIHILNHSDTNGGAARATYRIHQALREEGIDSTLLVADGASGDWTVRGPVGRKARLVGRLRPSIGAMASRVLKTGNPILHSQALLPSKWPALVNASDADLVHLVWVHNEMLSIEDVPKFRKPLVWTLQDMWGICGAEHVNQDQRPYEGYLPENRPAHESGIDINRLTWLRKRRAWTKPFHIVTPSRWMADCARRSALMRDFPISVIPNAIDTARWTPIPKETARQIAGLPLGKKLVLFGTAGANSAPHKGFDLLQAALAHLRGKEDIELVIFGEARPRVPPDLGFPAHYTGHLHDDISMQVLYSAADLAVIPSRVDNLPNVGLEALACGTPVVAFDVCGLPDIVDHRHTGYLARAFDASDLAEGIAWSLQDEQRMAQMRLHAREAGVARFSSKVVAQQYAELYRSVIADHR